MTNLSFEKKRVLKYLLKIVMKHVKVFKKMELKHI